MLLRHFSLSSIVVLLSFFFFSMAYMPKALSLFATPMYSRIVFTHWKRYTANADSLPIHPTVIYISFAKRSPICVTLYDVTLRISKFFSYARNFLF